MKSHKGNIKQRGKGSKGRSYQGVTAKKGLGQHFLIDEETAIEIVDSLLIPENDLKGNPTAAGSIPVLEIGPGTGVLTQYLLMDSRINLALCEIDPESVRALCARFPGRFKSLVPTDFLKSSTEDFFPPPKDEVYIIGNFPYNISSQIFFKILEERERITQVVCMLQREVAQRIAAPPGGRDYGILSVFLQAWYDIEYLFEVDEEKFFPIPKVKSAVIRLWRNTRRELGCDEALFKALVKSCFGQRRKTLRNSVKAFLGERGEGFTGRGSVNGEEGQFDERCREESNDRYKKVFEAMESTGLLSLRPEQLGVCEWIKLTNCLK